MAKSFGFPYKLGYKTRALVASPLNLILLIIALFSYAASSQARGAQIWSKELRTVHFVISYEYAWKNTLCKLAPVDCRFSDGSLAGQCAIHPKVGMPIIISYVLKVTISIRSDGSLMSVHYKTACWVYALIELFTFVNTHFMRLIVLKYYYYAIFMCP